MFCNTGIAFGKDYSKFNFSIPLFINAPEDSDTFTGISLGYSAIKNEGNKKNIFYGEFKTGKNSAIWGSSNIGLKVGSSSKGNLYYGFNVTMGILMFNLIFGLDFFNLTDEKNEVYYEEKGYIGFSFGLF